jgi:hypothetical protein
MANPAESNTHNPDRFQVQREMTITHTDFFRILPKAINHQEYVMTDNQISVSVPMGSIKIKLSPEKHRVIGSLRLPVTNVEIEFDGFSVQQTEQFFQQFDLSFHKGGG